MRLGSNEQITLTAGISDANPTIFNNDVLIEDNGWPNVEGRAAWAVGPLTQEGLLARRPFEVGVSGVIGQQRSTDIAVTQVVADVWGLARVIQGGSLVGALAAILTLFLPASRDRAAPDAVAASSAGAMPAARL